MLRRIEWRSFHEDENNLVIVEGESNNVHSAWDVGPVGLADFLNDMSDIPTRMDATADAGGKAAADWGDLVAARSEEGDVLFIEPEMFWDRIAAVFRARGKDPHPWNSRAN